MALKNKKNVERSTGTQFLALSMFIMLLAFFIILNSISTYKDDKIDSILNSLEIAFATKLDGADGRPSITKSNAANSGKEGDALDQIENIFKAQIPDYKIHRESISGIMYMRVRRQAFEYALKNIKVENPYLLEEAGFDSFLGGLVYLLQNNMSDKPYKLSIYLNLPDDPAKMYKENKKKLIKERQSISLMADTLEKAGIPKKLLNIGMQKGATGYIDLYFGVYKPIIPVRDSTKTLQEFLE